MGHWPHGRRAADRGLLLLLREQLPLDAISAYSERIVGVALIVVGVWGDLEGAAAPWSRTHSHAGASFAMGALHGLAGSSHLFGVLAGAGVFARALMSVLYLAGFGIGAMAAMSAFAAGMGLLIAIRVGSTQRRYRGLLYASSAAALVIGGFWLVGPCEHSSSPASLAAFVVMLAGFWLADLIGQQILAAQGLTGSSPLSGVPVAIVLGLLLRNTLPLPASLNPGLKFATTTILRAGIVLVGIRLSLFDVVKLGVAGLPVVLAAIATGLIFVTWFNRKLGLPPRLGILIAAGTSICGVTAIVSTAPAIEADEREVAYAVANVVAVRPVRHADVSVSRARAAGVVGNDRPVPRHRHSRHVASDGRGVDLQAGL